MLGEAGKQELLQQMFRKFWISNRLPNRYFFRKLTLGAPDQTLLTYTKYENQIQLIVEGTLFFKRNNEIILKATQAQQHTI